MPNRFAGEYNAKETRSYRTGLKGKAALPHSRTEKLTRLVDAINPKDVRRSD
jgi:hypothetical protein